MSRKLVAIQTPGAPDIKPLPESEHTALNFYISGRLGLADDPIKNSVLCVQSLIKAYQTQRANKQTSRWGGRGHLFACGVDLENDTDILGSLKEQARTAAAFEIEQLGFSDDQAAQYQILARSDIALMPSWHEGFGLSGWEALCAGVPLICSTQSGLALLVEQLKQRMPDVDFSSILPINLAGGAAPGSPVQKDIDELSEALQNAVASLNQRKQAALKLARLIKRDFTWERCAHQVIEQVGWGLPTSTRWTRRVGADLKLTHRADPNLTQGGVLLF